MSVAKRLIEEEFETTCSECGNERVCDREDCPLRKVLDREVSVFAAAADELHDLMRKINRLIGG